MTQTDTDVQTMTSDEALLALCEKMVLCFCHDGDNVDKNIFGHPVGEENCLCDLGDVPLLAGMRVECWHYSNIICPLSDDHHWTPNPDFAHFLKAMRRAGFVPGIIRGSADGQGDRWYWRPVKKARYIHAVEVTDDVDDKEAAYKAGLLALRAMEA